MDISRVSAPNERDIDLNTRRLKFLYSNAGMQYFVYYTDIDEIPGQRFLGLIFYALNQSTCNE